MPVGTMLHNYMHIFQPKMQDCSFRVYIYLTQDVQVGKCLFISLCRLIEIMDSNVVQDDILHRWVYKLILISTDDGDILVKIYYYSRFGKHSSR